MCYVMGGAQLMELPDLLTEEEKQYLDLSLTPCLQQCNGHALPPFAELNGKIIQGIGKETLLRIIKEEIRNAVR